MGGSRWEDLLPATAGAGHADREGDSGSQRAGDREHDRVCQGIGDDRLGALVGMRTVLVVVN